MHVGTPEGADLHALDLLLQLVQEQVDAGDAEEALPAVQDRHHQGGHQHVPVLDLVEVRVDHALPAAFPGQLVIVAGPLLVVVHQGLQHSPALGVARPVGDEAPGGVVARVPPEVGVLAVEGVGLEGHVGPEELRVVLDEILQDQVGLAPGEAHPVGADRRFEEAGQGPGLAHGHFQVRLDLVGVVGAGFLGDLQPFQIGQVIHPVDRQEGDGQDDQDRQTGGQQDQLQAQAHAVQLALHFLFLFA